MALNNNQTSPVQAYSVDVEMAPYQVFLNGASAPTSIKGPFTTSCTHDGTGQYTLTIVGWNPKVVFAVTANGVDNANLRDTRVTVDSVAVTNSTKTVAIKFTVTTLAGVAKDVAADANSFATLWVTAKCFSGTDASQR